MSFLKDSYFSWAWSPSFVAAKANADRNSPIYLPDTPQPDQDAYLCHFSTLRDGEQYSWIWLFEEFKQAVQVKVLPTLLDDEDPIGTLISSTIPKESVHGVNQAFLQHYPTEWLKQIDFEAIGIHEIWFGYDHKRFTLDRNLRAAVPVILNPDELRSELRK